MTHRIVWLDAEGEPSSDLLGGKGERLARMTRAGFPVPPGFCITTLALEGPPERAFSPALHGVILDSYYRLGGKAVAVRSSSTAEDLATASFAGQQDTFLNIRGEEALLDAIHRCHASLWTERAVAYRSERGIPPDAARMAVIVQTMIPCDVAGVAFSIDPLSGAQTVVIECARGLGESVVSGATDVESYRLSRPGLEPPAEGGLLNPDQARKVAVTVIALERLFGAPQDVEWGIWTGRLYVLQSRPITAAATGFFTEVLPDDDHLWTSGFLNERFSQPVSPLGWTLIRELLEPLAFRDPLRFMGYRLPAAVPVTKLYQGHPYVNVRVFQVFYKPFPRFLLPEDARRYFPNGDTELRRQAGYPRGLAWLRFAACLKWNFIRDATNWSPFHNYRLWERFTKTHDRTMAGLLREAEAASASDAWKLIEQAQALNARLLSIHRWSLTHADLCYTLLRRMLARWLGAERGRALAARLVSGVPNKSMELNRALAGLRTEAGWKAFVVTYGHRSFSLDVYRPTFAESPEEIRRLASAAGDNDSPLADGGAALAEARQALRSQPGGRLKLYLFERVLRCARLYMPLREDQRFFWQKTLAIERRLLLEIGGRLLARAEDVFFATMDELRAAAAGEPLPLGLIERRRAEFSRLERAPYPAFLRGNLPLAEDEAAAAEGILHGQPVSPGVARGPARVLTSPGQLSRLQPGDILVTRGADPGWTVVFGHIAGLVMETGGQLSHGAVVAREYGLPAVAGIRGATQILKDGEEIVVDGLAGTVARVPGI